MGKGLFITFEGIDGCGKSTQVSRTKNALTKKGVPCIVTREPGGTMIGEKIRNIILSPNNEEMCNQCEVLLYLAARAQHVHEIILPALQSGAVVLCDRFADATFAYQGRGRKLPMSLLKKMNDFAAMGIRPSLTFFLDISVECSVKRRTLSGKAVDRLEGNDKMFYNAVRNGYLSLAAQYPRRINVLKGEKPIEELTGVICSKIFKAIKGPIKSMDRGEYSKNLIRERTDNLF
jgi:dTMP kinase